MSFILFQMIQQAAKYHRYGAENLTWKEWFAFFAFALLVVPTIMFFVAFLLGVFTR